MLLALSSGLEIFPITEYDVGMNNISPNTKMTTDPIAGTNDFTHASDKKPAPYRKLPRNRAVG
jgi:hypothetical protein